MNFKKFMCAGLVAITLGTISSNTLVNITYASEVSAQQEVVTPEEKAKAINNLANALESAYDANPNMDEEQMAKAVVAYAVENTQESNLSEDKMQARIAAVYGSSFFSAERFGKCMLKKMGLGELSHLAKVIFEPSTVRYLKSHAWKKASAKIINLITRHASKKLAKFAVKQLAKFALPGIGWGSVALWVAGCGLGELH